MTRTTLCLDRSQLARVSTEITGMLERLERRVSAETHRFKAAAESFSAWEAQWEANRNRVSRRMDDLSGTIRRSAPQRLSNRPRLSVVRGFEE
jgi:uncharacterized protein YukE